MIKIEIDHASSSVFIVFYEWFSLPNSSEFEFEEFYLLFILLAFLFLFFLSGDKLSSVCLVSEIYFLIPYVSKLGKSFSPS